MIPALGPWTGRVFRPSAELHSSHAPAGGENMRSRTLGESFGVVLATLLLISVNGRAQDISTVAGTGLYGFSGEGGPATAAAVDMMYALACDAQGNIYIADSWNNRVRKVTPSGAITTIAGTGESGSTGDGGPATSARLDCPRGIAVDTQGNIYISDSGNSRIRKIAVGGTITTIAGTDTPGFSGDGAAATGAQLSFPRGLAMDSESNLYVADSINYRIRKINPQGIISTVAGMGACGPWGDGGPAIEATIGLVQSLALDPNGNLYFTDACFNSVRKVSVSGTISTVASNACVGEICGNGGGIDARFLFPRGLAIDRQGTIFVADSGNHRVRMIAANGTISSLAGTGTAGFSGDGGPAAAAMLDYPYPLALDSSGNLLVGDAHNYRIRKVTAPTVTLQGSRFELNLRWQTSDGYTGWGHPVKLTSESAYFYFFEPENLELMVKVLDGRPVNGSFWVFYGALTDLQFDLTIRDTVTGAVKVYSNPQGTQAGRYDISAFQDTSGIDSLSSKGLATAAQAESILLNNDRFQVEVDWATPGGSGKATGVKLTADSGYFWFFGPDNIELVLKILDARGVNGHFWVFYGALTDVQYTIKVTDSQTGTVRLYQGQQGVQSSGYDLLAF